MNFSLRLMRQFSVLLPCLFFGFTFSQTLIHHNTSWFGPNANPVPDFTDATIPENTQLSIYGDYYYGYGDNTETVYIKAEIPLIPQKVSVKVWSPVAEHYDVTDEIKEKRMMLEGNSGFANGDVYIQTRIFLAKELKYRPSVILNSTLKTASGSGFKNRRFSIQPDIILIPKSGKVSDFQKCFLMKSEWLEISDSTPGTCRLRILTCRMTHRCMG